LVAGLKFDGENSITEGETLYALQSVQHRQPLYHDYSHPPHVLTQYTPLFYLSPGLLARWLGTGTLATFAVGRSCAYVYWLGTAVLIYLLARRCLPAALVFLSAPLTTSWANSYRPDSAAVFFSLAAVLAYERGRRLAVP